jgi:outer membrane protein assembly factor BamB
LVLGAGKDGKAYLVDRDNMGHFNSVDNSQIVQTIHVATSHIFGALAFWQNNIYFLPQDDVLKAFRLSGGLLSTTPTSQASTAFGLRGASPAISANGSTNGIVWVLDNGAFATSGPAVLHAYDATNVAVELWNSSQAANSRDQAGPAVKFTTPTVANGKVYVGGQRRLTVYGLLP